MRGCADFHCACNALSSSHPTMIPSLSDIRPIVVRLVPWTPASWFKWGSPNALQHQILRSLLKPSLKCVINYLVFIIYILLRYFECLWTWSADPEFPPSQMRFPILWFLVTSSYAALTRVGVRNLQVSGTVDPVITDVLIMLATGLEGFMDRVLASSCLSPIVR